jgi:hypothetical protein
MEVGAPAGSLVPPAVLAAFLTCATAASGAPVTAHPGLRPAFRASTPDYTVGCRKGEPVRLRIDPPKGTEVAVGPGKPRSGAFDATVDLVPGRGFVLRFIRPAATAIYGVRCLPADFPAWSAKRTGTPQAGWYLVTPFVKPPNGTPVGPGYVAIFDSHGVPVWWMRRTPAPFDADLLPDGNLSWTDFAELRYFSGDFEERSLDGRIRHRWTTVGTETNQHDFQLLPNGDALLVTYTPRDHVDLQQWGGPADASVLDGEVQEVDPKGKLVWFWNTRDHVKLEEAGRWLPELIEHPSIFKADGTPVYDVAHVNSFDPHGNLLVLSARYLDAVYGIDRTTGLVLWKLGGTHIAQSLSIAGDPDGASEFGGQHDARLLDGERLLTVFDNGSMRDRLPRALSFQLDTTRLRATLSRSVGFPTAGESLCCGSARLLPGSDWVVSWGNKSWVTEQAPSGNPLLTIHFANRLSSYRAVPIMPGRLSRVALRRGMNAMAP